MKLRKYLFKATLFIIIGHSLLANSLFELREGQVERRYGAADYIENFGVSNMKGYVYLKGAEEDGYIAYLFDHSALYSKRETYPLDKLEEIKIKLIEELGEPNEKVEEKFMWDDEKVRTWLSYEDGMVLVKEIRKSK